MKPKTMILMVVAVTCGLGASYMTSRLLAQRSASDVEEKVVVLVATKPLDMGMTIKNPDDCFIQKEFPPSLVSKDAFTKPEDIKGKIITRPLRPNDVITAGDVLSDKGGNQIAWMMPKDHRAVGVRVNMSSSASGFATLPLSRVDLISTVRRGSDDQSFSQVLLENVLVLAIDTTSSRDADGRPMPGNVVTLALKPDDALKVELAKELGPLSLMLRKVGDNAPVDSELKVTVKDIITKNYGKRTEVDDESGPPVAKVDLPTLPKETAKAADVTVAEPAKKVFVMRILQGESEKRVEFVQNDKGEVVTPEVIRSDVETAPPRPTPSVTPPRPEGPAPPAPQKKE